MPRPWALVEPPAGRPCRGGDAPVVSAARLRQVGARPDPPIRGDAFGALGARRSPGRGTAPAEPGGGQWPCPAAFTVVSGRPQQAAAVVAGGAGPTGAGAGGTRRQPGSLGGFPPGYDFSSGWRRVSPPAPIASTPPAERGLQRGVPRPLRAPAASRFGRPGRLSCSGSVWIAFQPQHVRLPKPASIPAIFMPSSGRIRSCLGVLVGRARPASAACRVFDSVRRPGVETRRAPLTARGELWR